MELWWEPGITHRIIQPMETNNSVRATGGLVLYYHRKCHLIKPLPRGLHQYIQVNTDTNLLLMENGAFLLKIQVLQMQTGILTITLIQLIFIQQFNQ
jgi:hypothetical protein